MEFIRIYHKRAMRSVQIVVVIAFGLVACLGVTAGLNDVTMPVMFLIGAAAVLCVAVLVLRIQKAAADFNRYLDDAFSPEEQKAIYGAYLEGLGFTNSSFAGEHLVCLDSENPYILRLGDVRKVWPEQRPGLIPGIQVYRLYFQLAGGDHCSLRLSRSNYRKFLPDIQKELLKIRPEIDCRELGQ